MSASKKKMFAYTIKHAVRDTIRKMGLDVARYRPRGQENLPKSLDADFAPIYQKYHPYTMIPWQGLYAAYSAAKHVAINKLPGDIVECGVWKGGCMAIMAETLHHFGDKEKREFYLFDTFAGMSEPGEDDTHSSGFHANDMFNQHNDESEDFVDWCYGAYEGVEALMKKLPQSFEKIHMVKGMVEDTIPETLPKTIALLRLDTDWYDSTIHELNHMFPLLVDRGFLLVDDYGSWEGAKKAVDEYFTKNKLHERMFLHTVHGHGSVIGQLLPKK